MNFKICAALLLITPAAFATSVDLKTQLQSCQQISNEEQRLSCFDQIVSQLSAEPVMVTELTTVDNAVAPVAPQAPAAPVAAVAVTPPAAPAPAQQSLTAKFGLKKPDSEGEIQEIVSVVKSVSQDLRNNLLITLENGQQWRQSEPGALKVRPGDRCVVKRGAVGSFLFGVEGLNKKIRVRRVE